MFLSNKESSFFVELFYERFLKIQVFVMQITLMISFHLYAETVIYSTYNRKVVAKNLEETTLLPLQKQPQ
mgnify:CR=1 FL=1